METLVKLSQRHVQARPLTASAGGWSGAVCADEEKRGTEHDMTLSHEHCLLPGLILSCYNWGTGHPKISPPNQQR